MSTNAIELAPLVPKLSVTMPVAKPATIAVAVPPTTVVAPPTVPPTTITPPIPTAVPTVPTSVTPPPTNEFGRWVKVIVYFLLRLIVIGLGLFLAYLIVQKLIEPDVLDAMCITNAQSCINLKMWRWQNTFLAQEAVSQVWFWFNGSRLYLWGQASGTCDTGYVPATMFPISRNDKDEVVFGDGATVCIDPADRVQAIYILEKKSPEEHVKLYRDDPNELNTIFTVVRAMYANKIFALK